MAGNTLPVSALAVLAEQDPHQLQLHAEKIRELDFAGDDCKHHKSFKGLSFSKLERVAIDASDENEEHLLEPYLQPELKAFIFYGGPISDAFLDKLLKACPRLEELTIDNPRDLISAQGFVRFLDGAHNLQRVTILYGMDRVVTDDVFVALATRSNLVSLGLHKVLTAKLISSAERHQKEVDPPTEQQRGERKLFPRLQHLICTAEAEGLLSLLPHLSQLTSLDTKVVNNHTSDTATQGPLSLLPASCPNLQILKMEYTASGATDVSADELVILAQKLQHLQHLHLHGNNVRANELGNAHIAKIVEALPSLKVFQLALQCALTEVALTEVGKSCGRTLVECELWGRYNLSRLEGNGTLFPALEELVLGEIDQTAGEAGSIARLLKKIAPNLTSFDSISEESFAQAVERSWTEQSK